jgi:hypothetical protein
MEARCIGGERRIDAVQRRQHLPGDGHVLVADRAERRAVADERAHRLAAHPHIALGEDRLVLAGGIDAEEIVAGNIFGGQHRDKAGIAGPKR